MPIVKYLIDPPIPVFIGFLIFLLIVLWITLRRDHFYILVISTLLVFSLCEGILRVLNIGGHKKAVWREDYAKGKGSKYHYKPNGRLLYIYPDNPRGYFNENNEVIGSINSKGFRGEEREFVKKNNVIRIALIGDSFTLGIGVKDEDTLPANLERELNHEFPNVEVLNFGRTGSNTKLQVRLLEEYVLSFNPDIVIVVFFLDDVHLIGMGEFLTMSRIFTHVRYISFFINALFEGFGKTIGHRQMVQHYREGYKETSPGWKSVSLSLKEAKSLAHKKNFKFIVAVYPALIHLDERYPFKRIHQKIKRFCKSEHIQVVDLLDAFLGVKDSEMWVHPTDQHPNEIAHQIAGRKLVKYLKREKLIDLVNDKALDEK